MQIPDYFLQRPSYSLTPAEQSAFEELFTTYVEPGSGQPIPYQLDIPKWLFLCYLADHKEVVLHGSANPDISEFEPRQSNDIDEFGNRRAVYASSDGIWPIYFAIVNRQHITFLLNACFKVIGEDGTASPSYYYFSVDETALPSYPWQDGMLYLLPRASFEPQPLREVAGMRVEIAQWASPVAVKPLAKLAVTPQDFPFLSTMNGHDPDQLAKRASTNPTGFPWRE